MKPETRIIPTGEATAILPAGDSHSPIKVFGNESIRDTFDDLCVQQAINSRRAPGVTDVVLNPDAHCGYGAPIGCVLASPSHIYPGPVGFDIKCSMSLLQTDLPADAVKGGTAIDKDGNIFVTLENGQLMCFRYESQSSTTEPGKPMRKRKNLRQQVSEQKD